MPTIFFMLIFSVSHSLFFVLSDWGTDNVAKDQPCPRRIFLLGKDVYKKQHTLFFYKNL